MDDAVYQHTGLSEGDITFLRKLGQDTPLVADISRADVLIYCPTTSGEAVVVAQARPHSVPPIYDQSLLGQMARPEDNPIVFRALRRGRYAQGSHGLIAEGAPIVQEVHPIHNARGQVIGALSIEKTLIEHERHKRRSRSFRRAVRQFQEMVLRGEVQGAAALSPFEEHDGILVVDAKGRIQYASGVANNLYRKLGYMDTLPRKRLSDLETADEALVNAAMAQGRCLEEEVQEGPWIWIKKAIPLTAQDGWRVRWRKLLALPLSPPRPAGALLTVHDATEARRKEQELKLHAAMLQEIQHRVQNSLQTIIALLRLQARRASSEETRQVLEESINRILSVAAVHEFLFRQPDSHVVNIKDLSELILNLTARGAMPPEKEIRLGLQGADIYLPAQQATPCALVINELLQNALEHGYTRRRGGTISINLRDEGQEIAIEICDDGRGLPNGFDLGQDSRSGLRIVQTLVEEGLHGHFELRNDCGVSAIVRFPKSNQEV
ncbi:MAG: sensor histidine kinase [Anaerolineae bacterium]